jgi:hypothetical protein
MKKLMTLILVILSVSLLAADLQRINDVQQKPAGKDWYDYYGGPAYWFAELGERAVYYDVEDFGLEYPVNLSLITAYLYDAGISYTYKIYDKTMTTVIWESSPDSLSVVGYNDSYPANPIVLLDDFYVAMVPQADGLPRIIVDDGDGPYGCHSSYGTPGSMVSLYGSFDPLLPENNFLLGPWLDQNTDADIYPPIVRSFSGTDNFMGTDAPITIDVMDVAGVVTPIAGEYSLDGGAWTPFTLATAKSTSTLKGIIPGQADGTMGVARFTLVDSLGNSALSDEYPVNWSKDNTMLNESFEGEFPPANWTNTPGPTGAGFIQVSAVDGSPVHTGDYCLSHFYDVVDNDDWFISPVVSIPLENSCTLSLWQNGLWMSYYGFHEIAITTDGGTNWTQIYTGAPTNDGMDVDTGVWEELKFLLTAYRGQDIQVGFHYQGNDNDEWFIDDVKITYDYQAPQIVKVEGNESLLPEIGTFNNNDLVINLTLDDFAGVKSVTGYYSYDAGITVDTLNFAAAKVEEIWTGTIPAESSAITGTINFDLVDLGDVATTSPNYDFKFVEDTDPPVIESFEYGYPVFINKALNLELTFTDESSITSCTGSYTDIDGTVPVVMTPSKANHYVYTGTIPAKTEETFGTVAFSITDVNGIGVDSPDYEVGWLAGADQFEDDFEAGHNPADWTFTGLWTVTEEDSHTATHSLTESEGIDYPHVTNFSATINPVFDFTLAKSAAFYFWKKLDNEPNYDYLFIEGTNDGGATWTTFDQSAKYNGEWEAAEVSLGAFAGEAAVQFRIRFLADANTGADGAWVDDIRICTFENDHSVPVITYAGPALNVVGLADYVITADLSDFSDISETKVVYTVEGGAEQEVLGAPSAGPSGTFTYTIPAQAAMSTIDYKIVAVDASPFLNAAESDMYKVIFGNYLYYENGYDAIDYLDTILNGTFIAKRITMGPDSLTKDHYQSTLVGFTIDNYVSAAGGYPSDDMMIHVWNDGGNGPDTDLIVPFQLAQASVEGDNYAITYVDLRPYAAELTGIEGNVYVGWTSVGDQTCILYEAAAEHPEPEWIQFNRTWIGTGADADNLSWALSPDVYHMSGITSDYSLVDAPLPPLALTWTHNSTEGNTYLNWYANADPDLDYYNIYRGDVAGFALTTPIGSTIGTETTYVDTNAVLGQYYKVTAVDLGGQESAPSKEVLVDTGIEGNIPMVTSLSQNYPNPFNPVTTIKFSTAVEGNVSLTVYNTAGAVVAKLVDGKLDRGYHSVPFDGSKLVSGVYYYAMKLNDKVFTHKMMLIK